MRWPACCWTGPDLPVFFEDALGTAPVVGVSVGGETIFIDGEPLTPLTTGPEQA